MTELNRYQIFFIEDNIGKKSVKKIAQHLGVDKKAVESYIKRSKASPVATPGSWKITAIQVTAIFAIALLIRLIYLQQLSHTYFFAPFKGGFDDFMFDNWAREILKGNWFDDRALYIYRMPLYGYFLAFIYFLFGTSYWAAYLTNAFLGAASCIVVYFIGKIIFNRTVGFIAGLFNALSGPLLFFTGMVVGEALGIFVTSLAVLTLLLFERTYQKRYLFISGLLIGTSLLIKGSIIAVIPLVILWIFYTSKRREHIKPLACSALLLLGVLLPVLCIGVRNYIFEKDIVPITAQGGMTFYIGNAYGADGKYHRIEKLGSNQKQMLINAIATAEEYAGRKLKPSEVSDFWFKEAIRSIKDHGTVFIIPLLAKKIVFFWNAYEIPDIGDYYFLKKFVPLLGMPLFTFLLIVPLAWVGMYMSWPEKGKASILYAFIFGYLFSLMAAFMTSRYRIQVFPFLTVFAAYAIVSAKPLIKDGKKITASVAIFIAAVIFTNIPVEKIDFETSYNSLGIMLKRDGKIDEAMQAYNKAIEIAPNYPTPYYNLGILYRDKGDRVAAASSFAKAVELAPDFAAARRELERLGGGGEE